MFPGPWQKSGYIIKDILDILQIPFVTISTGEKIQELKGEKNYKNTDLIKSCDDALIYLNTLIKEKFISTFQHAAHVAIALHKTESPLKYGVKYIQDKDLEIKKYLND